jgi:beta-phosphoglucomutase-like phosphatase (HAD superfamily)
MSELQAVLFDMDGTLCDTEPAWLAAEFALATTYGAEWTREDGLRLVGSDLLVSGAYIQRRMRLTLSPKEIVAELVTAVTASVRADGVTWRPGALDLLAECNGAGMPTALVTMSYQDLVSAVLAAMPTGRFDAVVTGQDVVHGKPAPDAYLLAAEMLDVAATSSIAIEDSAAGAASAEAAGCLVVAVPHHVDIPAGPRRVHVPSLAGISLDALSALSAQR